jgi:phosphopantetheinyl transferase
MDPYCPHLYHETFDTEKGRIVVWKSGDYFDKIKGSIKKKDLEKQEIIRMLNILGYAITDLHYKESGQPMLKNDSTEYISISHSQGWFAIYLAEQPVGIDVEVERKKIGNGKDWFLNQFELENFYSNDELHIIWCAKEALYKLMEGIITDPKNEITINHIGLETINMTYDNREFLFCYKQIKNSFVVWS